MADESWRTQLHNDMEEARAERRRQSGQPYNDRCWKERSQKFLFNHPTCLGCGAPSEVSDHIVPLSVRNDDPLLSPIQALCRICHARKFSLEAAFRRGEIVESDLMMDSAVAQKLRKRRLGCDNDGYPLDPNHPFRQTLNARKGLK